MTRQGFPAANTPSGTSRVTTLPAPMTVRDPIRTPGRMSAARDKVRVERIVQRARQHLLALGWHPRLQGRMGTPVDYASNGTRLTGFCTRGYVGSDIRVRPVEGGLAA
jgi:hypothetical protein